jgi:PAS domain S-box-containing protein
VNAPLNEAEVLFRVNILLCFLVCFGWALLGRKLLIARLAIVHFSMANVLMIAAYMLPLLRGANVTLEGYFFAFNWSDICLLAGMILIRSGIRHLHNLACVTPRHMLGLALLLVLFKFGADGLAWQNAARSVVLLLAACMSLLAFFESNRVLNRDFSRTTRLMLLWPLMMVAALFLIRLFLEGMVALHGQQAANAMIQMRSFSLFMWISLILVILLNAALMGLTLNVLIGKLNREAGRLQQILDNAPVGVAISEGGTIRFANPRATQMLHMKVGDPSSDALVSSSDRAEIVRELKVHQRVDDMELQMYCPQKTPRDLLVTYLPIDYEGKQGILGWMIDITERKKADLAIRQANDEQTAIFEAATLGIAFIKFGKIVRVNRVLEQLFGVDSGEMIGRSPSIWWQETQIGESYPHVDIEHGLTHASTQPLRKKDGSSFWCRISGSAIDADDLARGTVWMFDDVTPEREAVQLMREAKDLAEDATRLKSNFLANMSHEIRTPMNAIIGMSHLALNSGLNQKQRHYIEKVDVAARNLLGIINDILDFSKIEAGKLQFERAEFCLDDVLENLSDMASIRAQEKGLELLFDVADDVPPNLIGDSLRLGQVLINLVGNAIKFTERGEITLAIRVARPEAPSEAPFADPVALELAPASDAPGVCLRFEVSDTGVGLTEEQRHKLFSPFSQADASTTRKYGGTGLGLTICKRLVELMGGEMGVASQPGSGSTFHFTAHFGMQDEQRQSSALDADMAGLSVLVVDDNARAREILQSMLTAQKFHSHAVASAEAALDALRQAQREGKPYGLVLMDWMMPQQDGLAAIRQIRNDPELHDTPSFVMVTAYSRDDLLADAKDTRIDGLLVKPVSPSSLLDGILGALGKDVVTRGRKQQRRVANRQAEQSMAGAYVLLVEDNPVNQELALEILQGANIVVDVANNGLEAVKMLEGHDYDGVLMDCQMPILDGYQATRRIRSDARFATLPILAMTANAMSGDKALCLAAGMNDHIVKPIDVNQLFVTMARWIKPQRPIGSGADDDRIGADGTVADFDDGADELADGWAGGLPDAVSEGDDHINLARGLRFMGGNKALLHKLLTRFGETQFDFATRIQSHIEQGDMASAVREAHSTKGLAGNIGAVQLAKLAGELESALKVDEAMAQGATGASQAALAALEPELALVIAQIPAAAGKIQPAPAPAAVQASAAPGLDRAQLAQQFAQLAALLANDEPRAIKQAEAMEAGLRSLGQGQAYTHLTRLIAKYEFEEALASLNAMAGALEIHFDQA